MGESKVNLGAGSPRFKIDNDSYGTVFFDPDNPQYGPAFGPTASEVKDPEDALEAVPYEYPVSPSFRREGSPKISFGIGGYQVTPRVFFEGSQTGSTPTVSLPEGDVLYDHQNFNVSGKLGADVQTPGGDTLGASAAGYAYRGGIEFPDALKAYGAKDFTYNSRGVEPSEYSGYYQMKDGPRVEGYYRPSAVPTREDEYGGRVSYTTSFEDGGDVGYYPEGPKVDLGDGAAKVAADIADLGPYLEGNYMAQLGLETLSPDRIFEIGRYPDSGFYAPQDATLPDKADYYDNLAFREMLKRGRNLSALFDPELTGTKANPLRNYLAYSYPDRASGDMFVEPFDTELGNRYSRDNFPKPKEDEYLDPYLTEEEARKHALGVLSHELTHAGDSALTRTLQVDDDVGGPESKSRSLNENYARLLDIMIRDRGLGMLQSPLGRQYEGKAVASGIKPRYPGDPFSTSVRKDGWFNSRERLAPKDFEKAVLGHPAQDAARRELYRRYEARTPTGGFEEGGPVSAGLGSLPESENILTSGTVSMGKSPPSKLDTRAAALGSKMLKMAGGKGNFDKVRNNANPEVISQINRIMARPKDYMLQSPAGGIALFMKKSGTPGG